MVNKIFFKKKMCCNLMLSGTRQIKSNTILEDNNSTIIKINPKINCISDEKNSTNIKINPKIL